MEEFDKRCIFFKSKRHKRRCEQLTFFPVDKEVEFQQLEESKKDRKIKLLERVTARMIINAAQNFAHLMNKTPTIDELTEVTGVQIRELVYGDEQIFYNYNGLLLAAGLEPNRNSPSTPPKNRF